MERQHGGEVAFKPFTEEALEWGVNMMSFRPANPDTQSGVLGFGRFGGEDRDAITILVGPATDVSDSEAFPQEFGGERVVYRHISFPEGYKD
jgi:hypothetical protein